MYTSRLPCASHSATHQVLRVGEREIPCHVLDDGRRLLTWRAILGEPGVCPLSTRDDGLPCAVPTVAFRTSPDGPIALGYEAGFLPAVCAAVLAASRAGRLRDDQLEIAARCEDLLVAFASVGVVAVIDENTAFERMRGPEELQRLLEFHLAREGGPQPRANRYRQALAGLGSMELGEQ